MNRQNIEDIYPLSPMQHGMLFHTLYDAKSEVYLEQIHCILGDTLDGAAFERALRALVARHGILRTVFLWEGLEEPLQIVLKTADLPFHLEDLRALPEAAQAARFAAFVEADKSVRFELDTTPPLRFALFRVGEGTYRFLWTFHHLVLDGWSLPVLMQDLFTFYDALRKRAEPRLPRPKPFGDYIEWLGQQDLKKAEAFWRGRLKGFIAATPYRVDHAVADQHAATTFAEQAVSIGPAAAKRLFAFAREHKLTVSTLVRAAWSLLLMRYSGEDDVCFGATVSGRSAAVPGMENIVGMCINMMPVRAELARGATTLAWLTAFQDRQAELAEYEYSPLVEVQAWSEIPRGEPLFQSILTFENYPFDEALLAGVGDVRVREFWASLGSNYPITVVCLPSDHDVAFRIVYDARRFDAPVAERLAGHLITLLSGLPDHAHADIGTAPMLSAAERELIVARWNETATDCGPLRCVHEVFEEWVAATPDAPAVTHEGTTLRYAELDAAANRLARWLVKQGVKPDQLVGIGLPATEQIVVALLAILKAGGAYVPIDPGLPDERIGHILADTQAAIVLTDSARAPRYERHGARVFRVDVDAAGLADESALPLGPIARPENLAYALFTSGSTGKSKGVLIEHRHLVTYVAGVASRLALPAGSSYALVSTFAADLGNTVLYGSLLGGGHLHVMGEERTKDPHAIAEYFGANPVDCLKIVPSHLQALLESPNAAAVVPRKCLVVGGEASSWELVEKLRALRPEHVLFNHYGPTETTVGVITNRVGERRADAPIVPLGRPLPNTTLYVLDRFGNPTPVGVPGELFIGGAQVARGYLRRPELTEERFVSDPFAAREGARLYRTGDSVKYLEDGTLLFLGRVDFQVKIRGYRIELGEIEAALRDNVSVRDAVALVQDDGADKRIVAFVVPMDPPAPPIATVREALAARVPDYMMPSALRWVEAVPLNANGKIDRQALFALEAQAEAAEAEGGGRPVAPRTPVEEVLAGIWADVFGVEKVGVHDNFNDLGGHSLVAIQVIARTRDALKVQIPLRAIFDSPTVAGLAERVEATIRAKQGLSIPALVKAPEGPTPLSFAQERLWFLDQLEPGSAFYNVPAAIRLTGRVDVGALERAIGEVVRRHDVLRTTFETTEGRAHAVAHPWTPFRLDVLAADDEEGARALAQKEAEKPFDLARGPLFRGALVRVGGNEGDADGRPLDHVLLFTMHHIVSDGWARGVLVRELAALYEAFAQKRPSPLDELPFQYGDFAHWQRGWLTGAVLDKEIAYWKTKLAGAPQALELPTDRPRPPVQSFRGALYLTDLPAELTKVTHAFAKSEGATLFMVLLGAWSTLLSRYARQTDVVVGSPIANRSQSVLEGLIGFFVNTLVLRTDLSGDPTFKDVVKRVRETALGAYAHQDLPFERLVEALSPERDLSRAPIFQVMFVLQNAPLPPLSLPGLMLAPLETDSGTAKFDLTLTVAEKPSGELTLGFEYNTDLFDAETIARMGEHFGVLLAAAVAEPKKRVAELPLMASPERAHIVEHLAGTRTALPEGALITDLIELEGGKSPDALAVTFEDTELTYGALLRASRQVARALQRRGVGPGSRVALSVERSPEMIVGIVGILLAGAAYVPFDPAWPRERLAFVLEDAGATLLLTQAHLAPSLEGLPAELLLLGGDAPFYATEDDAPAPRLATSESAAYVIYTSGSTGRPKGVAVTHDNLVYSTVARFAFYEAAPLRAFLLLSSFSFDSSVAGIFWSLASGATLVLPREGITDDPRAIVALIARRRVSHLLAVPSLYGVLLTEAEGGLESLRAAIVAGEAVLPELVARHHARLPNARLYNEYGPTEASVWCIAAELGAADARGRVPIGRPIPNARVYLLDERLAPVPVGVPGEIVIGGPGVTPGYLNLPDETAARFVASPFEEGRLYRTGDLGRFRRDGTVEFLGRVDHQVKIRGYRIEIDEIEGALQAHPGVREGAVAVREDHPGDKRLVGYFVAATAPSPTVGELRTHLKKTLPEYMVPQAILELPSMPLTATGKLDRKALPAPEGRAGLEATYAAPRSPVEEVVAGIWSELLGAAHPGIHDSFFELGGHSLLATQVVARIRKALSVDLPLQRLFETPTIAGLAEQVETAIRAGHGLQIPPIVRAPRDGALALSFAQERLWFLDQLEPNNPFYNVPSAIRITGNADLDALGRTLTTIAGRHEALRTRFTSEGGRPIQIIEPERPVRLAVVDLSALAEPERTATVRREAEAHARVPFDLAKGPLFAAKILRLGREEHVLLFTMHHIISDGWSIGVLLQELAALYDALAQGRPSPLGELPIQYADYAAWQRRWLDGDVLDQQLQYWKHALAGAPMVLEMPTDKPRPAVQTFRGARIFWKLPQALTDAVRSFSQKSGVTPFMTLLGAFDVLLGRYTGQDDVLVGTPIANRTKVETESLIGFLVNTLVIRGDLTGEPTFKELIHRLREKTLGAYANQDLPFERLVEQMQPERDLSRAPLFQVMFVLQNFSWPRLTLHDLLLEEVETDIVTAKFDVMFTIIEGQEGLGQKGELYGKLEYNTDLFERPTMERLVTHYETLLEGALRAPDTKIGALPLLPPAERALVVDTWNATAQPYRTGVTLHQLFAEQVARSPDAVAVRFEGLDLTYAELDRRANQLAHWLVKQGVSRDGFVAVCLERSLEMVIALYAVIKAGGAYVPVDPTYPKARIAFFVEDAAAPVLLTQKKLADELPLAAGRVLCLDTEWSLVEGEPPTAPDVSVAPEDLAYMIYTSGSTGRPKGAMNTHAGIVNRLFWMQDAFRLGVDDVVLQKTPFSFDVSVWEFFWALLFGARLVVAKPEGHKDAGYLVKLIEAEGVTTMHFVPSMLQAFLEEPSVPTAKSLRRVIASGEALPLPLTQRFFAALPHAELHNLYGPTEAAIDVTWWACEKEPTLHTVPIGKAIANTAIYILDPHQQPVPVGVPGELYIGGVQVARGYWNRPELSAERFVASPFAGHENERLYKTGDLVRWLPDGNIEYLRRIDFQVKLRGFRIELGEIEAALGANKTVRESVVVVREDVPGDKRIVAYLVVDAAAREAEKAAPEEEAAEVSRTEQWQMLYEETYRTSTAEEADFNIVGWNSSYTGEAIPPAEMRTWVEETVAQILALGPARVLEMGCGTGLLLFKVAPHVGEYTGSDFSQAALDYIAAQKARVPGGLANVHLQQRLADDYAGLADASLDAVVVNSVVQYFPSVDYLASVVEGALRVVRPGGHIFLGDVRNLSLLRALKASVALHQAEPKTSVAKLRDRMLRETLAEEELVLSPELFLVLMAKFPAISHVEVRPKPGRYDNELSRFRCDVVLHVGPRLRGAEPTWLDWQRDGLTEATLRERLAAGPVALGVRRLPNARVELDAALVDLLTGEEGLDTAADLRGALKARPRRGVEPEDLSDLADSLGYDLALSLHEARTDGAFDALFTKRGAVAPGTVVPFWSTLPEPRPWGVYGSDPLRNVVQEKVVGELRSTLAERLPDYMIPSAFVLLDALPLSPNGKVERKALPAPEARVTAAGDVVAPRSPVEEVLVGIYGQLLGVPRVSVFDDFFALGGHSLLATQAVSRVRSAFGVDLPLTALFEASTVADLASRVEHAIKSGFGVAVPPIEVTPRGGELALSFGQERLWFLDQLEPGSAQYNVPAAVRLAGRLDVGALDRALVAILERHEILRTVFPTERGKARQLVLPEVSFALPIEDLGALAPSERDARLTLEAKAEATTPFSLAKGPLVRARLLRLSDDEHVLLFTLHHIVSDGWSLGILVREIATLYEAFAADRPSPLPDLPIQYADYAAWQRRWLDGEVLARQLAYWKTTLAGAPEALDLPTDRPRPPMQSFRGAQVRVSFPGTLARGLAALSRKEGATLYMTLLAAFQVLLARSTGQDDIVVGTPVANRTRTETEGLIGFLINTLVVRTDLGGEPTFRDVLARVRTAALGAYAHQDVPFERLVEELRPQRDLSRSPLFQVMFALQNTPLAPVRVTGLSMAGIQADASSAKFDLTLTLEEGEDGLSGYFEYVTDLFDASTIERLAARYRTLLEGIVATPAAPIAELPLLPKAEQRTVLVDWNLTKLAYDAEARLFDAFRHNAARLGDKPAVLFRDEVLSYAELDARSNRLARYLAARGVRPGVLVGLFVERSAEMVVALLAILKAGGAYVPLDPAYPKGRIAMILRDAGAPVLVTESALAAEVDGGDAVRVLVDGDAAAIAREDGAPFDGGATADDVAYAIYTSGSTGTPKGVLVHHRALVNFMASMAREPGLTESERLLAVTSLSFDIAGLELYLPLTVGATVDVADRETAADGVRLAARLLRTGATLLQATPATFRLLLDGGWAGDPNLVILCGGEAFPRPLADALVPRAQAVWNMFGPTETTIWSTVQRVSAGGAASVPIGKPIANTTLYVVDRALRPVGIGIAGELLIGGDGVAKGYYRRDELTAERFIEHPLVDAVRALEPNAELSPKVYRTGDLVRWLADGTVEFLGRLDHQVKLRGYRIELGEIEAVLGEHPAVREVVVVAREDATFDKRLVAYVALVDGASVTVADARAHLRERLPDYMLPAHFVVLAALPRTPNGKIDRKALPAPEGGARQRERVAPTTAAERLTLRLFAQVLRAEDLGITDDFFEVGGHSLLAAQLVARLTDAFRIELPVRVLFEAGTVLGVIHALNRLWGDAETVEAIAETTLSVDELSDEDLARMMAAPENAS